MTPAEQKRIDDTIEVLANFAVDGLVHLDDIREVMTKRTNVKMAASAEALRLRNVDMMNNAVKIFKGKLT